MESFSKGGVFCISKVGFFAGLVLLAGSAAPVHALTSVNSPDDICSPSDDPCIVDEDYEVLVSSLDFGTRAVTLTPGARLIGDSLHVLCGDFSRALGSGTGAKTIDMASAFTLTAQRSCSGNSSIACLSDSICSAASAGSCSVGTGEVLADIKIVARSSGDGGDITIRAAGDVALYGNLNTSGTGAGTSGGAIDVTSYLGDVLVDSQIRATVGATNYYDGAGDGGNIRLESVSGHVTLSGNTSTRGGAGRGGLELFAAGDVRVTNDVNLDAGQYESAEGGCIHMQAGGDVVIERPGGSDTVELSTDGGGVFSYGSWVSGYGGEQYVRADGDVRIGEGTRLRAFGGAGDANGGPINLRAGQSVIVNGTLLSDTASSASGYGEGGTISLRAEKHIDVGNTALVSAAAHRFGGRVVVDSEGTINIDGRVDVRARAGSDCSYGYCYPNGTGGEFELYGTDVEIAGNVQGGGTAGSNSWQISACRLILADGARVELNKGQPNPFNRTIFVEVVESMLVEDGARLLGDNGAINPVWITYRTDEKPPFFWDTSILILCWPSIRRLVVARSAEIAKSTKTSPAMMAIRSVVTGVVTIVRTKPASLQLPATPPFHFVTTALLARSIAATPIRIPAQTLSLAAMESHARSTPVLQTNAHILPPMPSVTTTTTAQATSATQ